MKEGWKPEERERGFVHLERKLLKRFHIRDEVRWMLGKKMKLKVCFGVGGNVCVRWRERQCFLFSYI